MKPQSPSPHSVLRVLLSGCGGHMGRTVARHIAGRCDCRIVAGLTRHPGGTEPFPVWARPEHCRIPADVLIDFSHPSQLGALLDYAAAQRLPAVIGTTGLQDGDRAALERAARQIPVFYSANLSEGLYLLSLLAYQAAAYLGSEYDIEILEMHHSGKRDAPSGTALLLADSVRKALPYTPQYVYDRHTRNSQRDPHEIGFASLRGGTVVGEHSLFFAGPDDVITLTHSTASKDIFASGALRAAFFLQDQPAGLYGMQDLLPPPAVGPVPTLP